MMKNFNPDSYESIAREVFAPIYPVIAEQIVARTGVTTGQALDVGSGGGHLGLALAGRTSLAVGLIDATPGNAAIAEANIAHAGLADRVRFTLGNAQALPVADGFADLVVSRGSVFFWDDMAAAFGEILRVLKPDGQAYIGGGFGSNALLAQVTEGMRRRIPDWAPPCKKKAENEDKFAAALRQVGVTDPVIINDESGHWVHFRRQPERMAGAVAAGESRSCA